MKRVDPYAIEDGLQPGHSQVVAELARRATAPTILTPQYLDASPFIVLRDESGKEVVHWLKERKEAPHRKTGTITAHDAAAFAHFFKIHGAGVPQIYASLSPVKFTAIINDHLQASAGYRDFRCEYPVNHSPEWMAWMNHNGKKAAFTSTEEFALFIEQNGPDFVSPDASKMMEMVLNFRIRQGVHYDDVQRLQDGQLELTYRVTNQAVTAKGNKITIPESFKLRLRVWDGPESKMYPINAAFRYRLSEGQLTLWYELERPKRLVESAFRDLWTDIEKETKAKVLYATPGN
jgi:uncharacterized protein YfdQ (DUF2303 family)